MEDGSVSLTEVERDLVLKLKEAKRSNLVPGSKWNLVDIKWMRQWCNYVNYDGFRSRYVDISNPGPMKNTSLLADGTNKLKRNLLEDVDYYLVPSELYKTFEELYGGGPDVVRNVVPCSGNSRVYMVDLYPMKYNVYVVDGSSSSSSDEASPVPSEPRAVIEQSKYTGFDDVKASVMKALSLSEEPTHYNIWVRKPDYYTSYATTADDEPEMPAEDQGEVRRYLKESKTDTLPGSWVFLKEDEVIYTHHYPNGTIDMLVELLSEPLLPTALEAEEEIMLTPAKAVLVKELREDANSRRGLLSHWLKDLRIGDVVDGKDISGKWYEAVVVPLPPTAEGEHPPPAGSVRLHFKCWSAKWDDTVLPKDIPGRIWPLYSKTPNWRSALRAGDYVEVLTSAPDAVPRWEAATVSSVDLYRGFVKLRYSQEFKTLSLQSDSICQHPTHVKEVSRPASSAITISSSSGSYLSSAYRSTSNWMSGGRSHEAGALQAGGAPGVVGLRNLGNTCFMNSMLQCLSHAKPLTDVFLSDRYLGQINTDNVLGMGGKIANVYGKLLKDMWAQKYSVVNPYEFKDTIGEFQPQFAGYQQQDSQEFMLYLLDGLHEDMNRVIKKPFVEKIESKGRADDLISREAWRRFLLRNDSEIVDRVFGQLKSHVTCRNCGHVSVTFDEFNSLALPVPVKNKRKITVTLFPLPVGSIPIIVTLEVDLTSSIRDLKEALVTVLGPDVLMTAPAGRTRKRGLSLSSDDAMDIDSEPYVLVGADGESPKSGTDEQDEIKPMVKSASAMDVDQLPAPPAGDAAKKYFFHVASYSTYSKKVTWTLADDSPVQDITKNGSTQQLFVFQLEHDASKREYHEYDISAAVGYTSYSTYLSTEKKPKADEPGLRFVDVVMMRPPKPATSQSSGSYYSTYNYASTYPTLMGHGCRLSFEIGVTKYRDLYDKIEALALGLLPANSPYEGFSRRKQKNDSLDSEDSPAPPFVVYLSNQHGSNTGDEFPFDSDAAIDSIFARHQIIVMWSEDALTQLASASNDDPLETSTVEDNLFKRRKFNRGVVSAPFITDKEAIPNADQDSDKAEEKKRVNINDCLDKFIEREIMPEEETWYCPACKEHKSPIKKFDIWAAPEILIVQLKRFQYIPGSYFIHREKINDLVDFPIDGLDLTPYVRGEQRSDVPPPVYDLFAVSEHSGGLGGGHYTAVAKSPDSDDWINYNDSYCSRASTDDIVTPAAYILFYKRRGKDVKWAGIEPLPLGVLDQDKST